MKFTAAGDAIIQRRIPENFEGFSELYPIISQGDARFFNLETTLNREGESCVSQLSGGTYIRTNPEVLDDLKKFGFNMTSFNNNHALDFSYEGLEKTLESLDKSGLVHAGVGKNLDEAAAPKFLDTEKGRVALIAVNTSFNPAMLAGKQTGRIKGRPGIFGVGHSRSIIVKKDDFKTLKDIIDKTQINAYHDIIVKEGYEHPTPDNILKFEGIVFEEGDDYEIKTWVNETDMGLLEKSIREAKFLADYVIISVHSHQMSGTTKETPSQFLEELAHKCVDAGADAVIGHGPHLLRPVEVYKEKPIFYSLGDFILELYSVEFAPHEFFSKFGVSSDSTVYDLLKKRSRDFTVGLMEQRVMFQTIIPVWEYPGHFPNPWTSYNTHTDW